MKDIENLVINLWLIDQLFSRRKDIVFSLSYRTVLTDWTAFVEYDGQYKIPVKYSALEEAEEQGAINSQHYENSLVKVSVGTITISLWQDGECVYQDSELHSRLTNKQ